MKCPRFMGSRSLCVHPGCCGSDDPRPEGRLMGSSMFLLDLLRGHEPRSLAPNRNRNRNLL
jgi:hypothetical protein